MIGVDASLAVKWILEEVHGDRARALYLATVGAGQSIVAPPLLPIEVTNILRQRMRVANGITHVEAARLLTDFLAFAIEIRNFNGLHHRALALADTYGLPAAYDAHYVAVAERLGCELWTDDQRLLRTLAGRLPFVRWIGEYEPDVPRSAGA